MMGYPYLCPKCNGRLTYDEREQIFTCTVCENRFFREMIAQNASRDASGEGDLYIASGDGTANSGVQLTSQFALPEPTPEGKPLQVVRTDVASGKSAKSVGSARKNIRRAKNYDRAQKQEEEERLRSIADISSEEERVSASVKRDNEKNILSAQAMTQGVPETPVAPPPIAPSYAPAPKADLPALNEEEPQSGVEPDAVSRYDKMRLALSVEEARLQLKHRRLLFRRRSKEIWEMTRDENETRREFKVRLQLANRELDALEVDIKEAKETLRQAKKNAKKNK